MMTNDERLLTGLKEMLTKISRFEVATWRGDDADVSDYDDEVQAREAFEQARRDLKPGEHVELNRVILMESASMERKS